MQQDAIKRALQILDETYTNPGALEIGTSFQVLSAVALSARSRDEQVLSVLPCLFERFPTPQAMAKASAEDIESCIDQVGLYRQKAKRLKRMSEQIMRRFDGKVPDTMGQLTSLSGVGRKTASVVLVSVFDKPAIAVDTHVHRVTNRLGWVDTDRPKQTERELLTCISKDKQHIVNRVFVKFGRAVCIPRKPRCWMCPLKDICAYPDKNLDAPQEAKQIKKQAQKQEEELEALRRRTKRQIRQSAN